MSTTIFTDTAEFCRHWFESSECDEAFAVPVVVEVLVTPYPEEAYVD